MIAGLLATGLLLFVLAMICCIAEVVYEGDKKDKGESFRRTESFPEKYFSEASTVFQTTARSTVESSVWSRSSEGTSVDFIEDDDDDDDDEDDDLESEVDEEEEEGLSGSRIFRNLKAFTERMKATPLK